MKILLTLFCIGLVSINDHDIPLAIFNIYQRSHNVSLEVTIDTEDLTEDLNISANDLSKEVLVNYLTDNTSFSFDNIIVGLEVNSVEHIGDHIKINCDFTKEIKDISHIKIINTCLLNVPNQSNIIQVNINSNSKDYRMHKKRKTITVEI